MSHPAGGRFEAIPGSEREMPAEAVPAGAADPTAEVDVSVYLRPRTPLPATPEADSLVGGQGATTPMSREDYASQYGADQSDIAAVEQYARASGLTVVEASQARRVVVLRGTIAALSAAFAVDLSRFEGDGQTFRGRTGPIHVPAELAGIVEGIFGLDDRPQAHTRMAFASPALPHTLRPEQATSAYTPPQVASLYDYPAAGGGQSQTIGIIELGGGYQQSDLDTFFQQLGLATPHVVSVVVDGGTNVPGGDPNGADGEVLLDIEVAGSVAPGARIAVYFAPNTDRGFLDAVTTAVHDTANTPSVISISWGSPESSWTLQAQQQMSQAFNVAAALGVTVCCAAGDNGASDGAADGLAHADFPASSPYALACGGTRLESSGGAINSETVWNDGIGSATGGGISDTFGLPVWQASAGVPPSINPGGRIGRGVPDVAGDADPQTGYRVQVDGQSVVIGGTSAVAPLWAGLIALLNQRLGKPVGFVNPLLYQTAAAAGSASTKPSPFHDITSGNNNGYSAAPGWDACTGLGSPNGAALLSALQVAYGQPVVAPAPIPAPSPATAASAPTPAPAPVPVAPSGVPVEAAASSRGMLGMLRGLFRRN